MANETGIGGLATKGDDGLVSLFRFEFGNGLNEPLVVPMVVCPRRVGFDLEDGVDGVGIAACAAVFA